MEKTEIFCLGIYRVSKRFIFLRGKRYIHYMEIKHVPIRTHPEHRSGGSVLRNPQPR